MIYFDWVSLPPVKGITVHFCCSLPRPSPRPPRASLFYFCPDLRGPLPTQATSPGILAGRGALQPIPVTGAFLGSTRGRNSPAGDLEKLPDLPPGAQAGLWLSLSGALRTEPPGRPAHPHRCPGPYGPLRRWAGSRPPQRPTSFGSPSSSTVAVLVMRSSTHDRRNPCTNLRVHIYIFRL